MADDKIFQYRGRTGKTLYLTEAQAATLEEQGRFVTKIGEVEPQENGDEPPKITGEKVEAPTETPVIPAPAPTVTDTPVENVVPAPAEFAPTPKADEAVVAEEKVEEAPTGGTKKKN